jgi:predicted nucleotidyltransferase
VSPDDTPFADIESTLKKAAATLRDAQIPFLLGGSLAAWARGGPDTQHDIDLMLKEEDVDRALAALEEAGFKRDIPPEDWLVKAWDGDVLVDLIHHARGLPIDDAVIGRGEELTIRSMHVRVMALEDVLTTKLMALTEHDLRYDSLLRISRALRERIDWDYVREHTAESPFARAFFVMLEGLGVVDADSQTTTAK